MFSRKRYSVRLRTVSKEGNCLRLSRLLRSCCLAVAILFVSPFSLADTLSQRTAVQNAITWLETMQNADGSWGTLEDTYALHTSSVVRGLQAAGVRSSAYFRGITWLENHQMSNVDYHARRILALIQHGDDLGEDIAFLTDHYSNIVLNEGGWGISNRYASATRDTALALLAIEAAGSSAVVSTEVQAGLDFLSNQQNTDGGWPAGEAENSNPAVSSLVLQALAAHRATDASLIPIGDVGFGYLWSTAVSASAPLQQSQAVIAFHSWNPGTVIETILADSLALSQLANGSWGDDAHVTGLVVEALSIVLGTTNPTIQAQISFQDLNLRGAINLALGRNRMDAIRRVDLISLEELDLSDSGIENLSGLEEAVNLVSLDLRGNPITDITPVSNIASLGDNILLQGTPWAGPLCDVNDDGVINAGDFADSMRIVQEQYTPDLAERTRADIAPLSGPGDGAVRVNDLQLMQRQLQDQSIAVCGE